MKFSLEWLLILRKTELSEIEAELLDVNTRISNNMSMQSEIKIKIKDISRNLYVSDNSMDIHSKLAIGKSLERQLNVLEDKLIYFEKELEMVKTRFVNKQMEVKALEKNKEKFLEKEKVKKDEIEAAELNELSLMLRKD